MDKIFKFKLSIFIQMISIAELNAEINERILSSQSEILKLNFCVKSHGKFNQF